MRIAPRIELDAAVQRELTALARRAKGKGCFAGCSGLRTRTSPWRLIWDRRQVALWRQRLLESGVEALDARDAPRPGRTPSVSAEVAKVTRAKAAIFRTPGIRSLHKGYYGGLEGLCTQQQETRAPTPKVPAIDAANIAAQRPGLAPRAISGDSRGHANEARWRPPSAK